MRFRLWFRFWALELLCQFRQVIEFRTIARQALNLALEPIVILVDAYPLQPKLDLSCDKITWTENPRNVFVGVVGRQRTTRGAIARRWPWGRFFHVSVEF